MPFLISRLNSIKRGLQKRKIKKRSARKKSFHVRKSAAPKNNSIRSKRLKNAIGLLVVILLLLLFVLPVGVSLFKFIKLDLSKAYLDSEDPDPWVRGDRLNLLIVGLDRRDGEYAYIDAANVIMIDPGNATTAIFPVDTNLSVQISDGKMVPLKNVYNESIMAANGSPIKEFENRVELLLSINIDRYILLDEEDFVRFTDVFGGIYVDNQIEFVDNDFTASSCSIKKGSFRLGGNDLLCYISADSSGLDMKMARQSENIKGFIRKIESPMIFVKLPQIIDGVEQNLLTNMSKTDLLNLFSLLLKSSDIKSSYLKSAGYLTVKSGSEDILLPDYEILDNSIRDVFADPKVQREQARVEVFNSTGSRGLATFRARWLRNVGVDVIRTGDSSIVFERTTLYISNSEDYTDTINIVNRIFKEDVSVKEGTPDFITTGDIVIVLGKNALE